MIGPRDLAALPLVVVVIALLCGAVIDCCAERGEAQDRPVAARLARGGAAPRDYGPPADVLTRALVAEVDAHGDDMRPLLAVFQSRADRVGTTPARLAVRYCRIYRTTRPTPRMAEVLAMPGVMSPHRAEQWARAHVVVEAWLAGDHAHGCSEVPTQFGDRHGDAARARRMRWREVTCPGSLSGFWREAA